MCKKIKNKNILWYVMHNNDNPKTNLKLIWVKQEHFEGYCLLSCLRLYFEALYTGIH